MRERPEPQGSTHPTRDELVGARAESEHAERRVGGNGQRPGRPAVAVEEQDRLAVTAG
jgi:hypothetical protein